MRTTRFALASRDRFFLCIEARDPRYQEDDVRAFLGGLNAKEVVVMGKLSGNVTVTDRVDIRAEGSVHGDISTSRISVEDGASLKGGIQVRSDGKAQNQSQTKQDQPKAMAATASA